MRGFYDKVSNVLEDVIEHNYGLKLGHPLWELPQKKDFGDLSSMVALRLASKIKKDPLDIANQIKSVLEKKLSEHIERIEILRPGFINIFISQKTLIKSLNEIIKNKDNFFRSKLRRKVIIEFLSANPTGPLSIAHGRQAVVGDSISNVLEFFGNKVEREYYLNDEGRQIELLVKSIEERAKELKGDEFSFPEEGYKGEYIKDIARKFLDSKNRNTRKFVLSYIISLIKKDLNDLQIEFTTWASQRKLIRGKKVAQVINNLTKGKLIYEKEGALWFNSTKFGDDKDRVIKKADGELTYFASDIAYHNNKCKRGPKQLINLWGPDHHGYIKRVKSALSALNFNEDILKIIIIQLVTIKTKERMSRRAGTAILLSELIKEVGKDAARFYYLTRRNSSHLEFDIDLAKEASFNNPLYYIQYVCARIESIFRRAKISKFRSNFSKHLSSEQDLSLLRTLLQFPYCLDKAYYTYEPVFIIEFLKNLAASFHKFYEAERVINEDDKITQARLNLLEGVRVVFHCGLKILGITPAERM